MQAWTQDAISGWLRIFYIWTHLKIYCHDGDEGEDYDDYDDDDDEGENDGDDGDQNEKVDDVSSWFKHKVPATYVTLNVLTMGLGQAKGLSQAKASRGWAIVTGLQFIKSSADWRRNEEMLISHGALMRDGIDVFDVKQNMPETVNLQRVGLVVVGGFYPHWRASAVVQALAHQMPSASLLILYASRYQVPRYQDHDKVHIQAWTADASKGYVVKAGGGWGHSRCYSEESVKDNVWSDPSLVKVSIFTSAPSQVSYVDAKLSPSMYVESFLSSNRHVLFCCEGDASLPCSCLQPSTTVAPTVVELDTPSMMPGRYHRLYGSIESYKWLLDQRHVEDAPNGSFAQYLQEFSSNKEKLRYIADTWAESWPMRERPTIS